MINLRFSIYEYDSDKRIFDSNLGGPAHKLSHNAIWSAPRDGDPPLGTVGAGNGKYMNGNEYNNGFETMGKTLRFEVSKMNDRSEEQYEENLTSTEQFDWPDRSAILRLDQVTFPSGAVAYRHIHSGVGFRHLAAGGLTIDTGEHQDHMVPGCTWFEDINSPVKATAMTGSTSQFIRAMLIPLSFEGKSTIKILDPQDQKKPTLQKNYRFFDQRIDF